MKIISWNCNMAFRNKAAAILKHKPDLLIIPECEHPDKLIFPKNMTKPSDSLWFGKNLHKGLGIFSFCDLKLKLLDDHNEDFKMIVPIVVTGRKADLILFAIWANNPADKDGQYVTQVWKAIHYYESIFTNKHIILIGDFNSNTIWDRKRRTSNHSNVVKYLKDCGIVSAYHLLHKQEQGKEKHPTYFLYRHKDKPYHLDYCFVSRKLADKIISVEIGKHRSWSKYSDHVPVIVEFKC